MEKSENFLNKIQGELKAPKSQFNSFGKYKYRSCEDILEAVKPLLKESGYYLLLSDKIIMQGGRYYVEATAKLTNGIIIYSVTASAREEEVKKGMDSCQITGATSSYARKYALNGLFAIDDTKDADTNEHSKSVSVKEKELEDKKPVSVKEKELEDNKPLLLENTPKWEEAIQWWNNPSNKDTYIEKILKLKLKYNISEVLHLLKNNDGKK